MNNAARNARYETLTFIRLLQGLLREINEVSKW
jgi:hypothetical protein